MVEFTSDQLATGGALDPQLAVLDRLLPDAGHTLRGCYDLAFDAQGTLWVGNRSAGTVVAYSGLAGASGAISPLPNVLIGSSTDGGPALSPYGLAFDSKGNLWVGNGFNGQLLEYSPSQLVAGGNLTPIAWSDGFKIDGGPVTQPKVSGLAFDNSGSLWVTSDSAVFELTNLGSWTGRMLPVPSRVLPGLSIDLGKPAFNNSPTNLPLP